MTSAPHTGYSTTQYEYYAYHTAKYVDRNLFDCHAQFLKDPQPLLLVLLTGHPERVSVLHDISQDGPTQEHHVLTTGRIFNSDFEFLRVIE